MLTRTYSEEIGASWTEAFGTDDRGRGGAATAGPTASSSPGSPTAGCAPGSGAARSCGTRSTGQRCWFNQIAFLNEWTLAEDVREYLVDVYGEDGLPFNTRFGNGDPIGEDIVQLLNEINEANTAREPWQAGDLMLVDNIRTAHSREAYDGPREVLVGMADPVDLADCSPTDRGDADDRRQSPPPSRTPVPVGAAVRGDLRGAGPAGAAGPGEADRRAGRGHLPVARRRRLGQPAVVLPALPGPPVLPDHRPARVDRRAGAGGRPQVDLQLPGERGGRASRGPRRC